MSDAQKLIADVHYAHEWLGECLGCRCGWNWPEERTHFCGEEERISKAHSAHVAAEIDKALGGLAREERVIEGVFEMGVPEPAARWVSGWSEAES